MTHPKWKLLKQTDVSPSRWFPVLKDLIELPTGQKIEYFKGNLPNVAMVVPITPLKEVVLVRQYKHGVGEVCLEFPAGRIEKGQSAEQAAVAELKEETGIVVTKDQLIPLGELWTEPSKSTVRVHGYLALNVEVSTSQELEITEQIEVVKIPIHQLSELIKSGELHASDTLALLGLIMIKYPELMSFSES